MRQIRDTKQGYEELQYVFGNIQRNFPADWLLAIEILEILKDINLYPTVTAEVQAYLYDLKVRKPEYKKLIEDGIRLADEFELSHP